MFRRLKRQFDLAGGRLPFFAPFLADENDAAVLAMQPETLPDSMPGPARRVRKRAVWGAIAAALILLTPLLAYWPTIFHYYGLRDSYSNLREAHEEPGKLMRFCASHARPIYGWLLEVSLSRIDTIRELQWMRLLSALLLGAVSLVSYRLLRRIGWSVGFSLLLALWLGLLPSAQVFVGWEIGWPYSVAVLLTLAAFWLVEGKRATAGDAMQANPGRLAGAVVLVAASALVYQPNALFYTVPLTALVGFRRRGEERPILRRIWPHVAVVGAGLALAYATIRLCYAYGIFRTSARIAFESQWIGKLRWFVTEPLPNALSFFVINDDHRRDHTGYLLGAIAAGVIILAGVAWEWHRRGRARGMVWLGGLLGLPLLAFAISLVAAEHYATYRTILPLSGVLLCWLLISLHSLFGHIGSGAKRLAAFGLIASALLVARHRAYALLAVPQGNEWQLILEGAAKVRLDADRPTIFAIEPSVDDISTTTIYHDEFGSLSSNSEWVPKEMFKRAMHDLHPEVPQLDQRYRFASGWRLPSTGHFDVIIDLRMLRKMRPD